MKSKNRKQLRSSRGTFLALVSTIAFFLLLPICVFAFEVGRLNLAQRQLQVATDAAAMAGALYVQLYPELSDQDLQRQTDDWALMHVKRNLVMSTILTNSRVGSPATDPVGPDACVIKTTIDKTNNQVRADSEFGLVPAFGRFLGLNQCRIAATSKAGLNTDGPIDVVFILDHSGSMRDTVSGSTADDPDESDPTGGGISVGGVYPGASPGAAAPAVATPAASQSKMIAAQNALADLLHNLQEQHDAHFGLVKFAEGISVPVTLSQNDDKAQETLNRLTSNPTGATYTGPAMNAAVNMLNGSGHRPQAKKVIVLLTDGLPHEHENVEGHRIDQPAWNHAYAAAIRASHSDITTYTLGLFTLDPQCTANGKEFIKQFDYLCGNPELGGQSYFFNDISGLQHAVESIQIKGDSEISLLN